jgi:hypothetical protein
MNVAGGLGPHGHVGRCHVASPNAPLIFHVTDPWEKHGGTPRRSPTLLINVGLI